MGVFLKYCKKMQMNKIKVIKIAKRLAPPQDLSEKDLIDIDEESTRWREAVRDGTETLERLAAADFEIRMR